MALPLIPAGFSDSSDPARGVRFAQTLSPGRPLYFVGYGIAVFVLVYLYTAFVLDPDELAATLKRHGVLFRRLSRARRPRCIFDAVLSGRRWSARAILPHSAWSWRWCRLG